jgi:hypothetical protein
MRVGRDTLCISRWSTHRDTLLLVGPVFDFQQYREFVDSHSRLILMVFQFVPTLTSFRGGDHVAPSTR